MQPLLLFSKEFSNEKKQQQQRKHHAAKEALYPMKGEIEECCVMLVLLK
jgi:hypothetical protein